MGVAPLGVADLARIAGSMSIAAGASLEIGNPMDIANFAIGDQWKMFDWSGPLSPLNGTFTDVNLPALSGMYWDITRLYNDGIISITMVPEPCRARLLFLGTLFGILQRRRR